MSSVGTGCAQPQAVALINSNWCDFISSGLEPLYQFDLLQYDSSKCGGVFSVD